MMAAYKLTDRELDELKLRAETLAPADDREPHFDSLEDGVKYLHRTVGLTAHGVYSLLAMTRNGGVPAKRSRKTAVIDNTVRGVIIGLLIIILGVVATRSGSTFHAGMDGVTITPKGGP